MAERIKLKERKEIENSKRKKSRNAKVTENKEKKIAYNPKQISRFLVKLSEVSISG
jgi:hypothetical protein